MPFRKKSLLDQAGDWAGHTAGSFQPRVESVVEQAREAVEGFVESAKPVITDALTDARDKAGPALADARDRAVPALVDARDRAVPVINDRLAEARKVATPYVVDATTRATEGAVVARSLAEAKVARLRGEPEPKKGGTLKKIVLFAAVAAAVAFLAKKLQGGKPAADSWQSSYTPAPAPKPAASPGAAVPPPTPAYSTPPVVADPGGASPDEAVADAVTEIPVATTPDDPAEVIELPTEGDSKP